MNEKLKDQVVRLFVAIDLPENIINEIDRIQNYFKKLKLFKGRYTTPDQMHLTLKFIGSINKKEVATIQKKLETVCISPFRAKANSLGVFSTGTKIKILFLNIVSPGLKKLAKMIDDSLSSVVALETRQFVSHVTLARITFTEDKPKLLREVNNFFVEPIDFMIRKFVLKESELTPGGAQYKDITTFECDE